MSVYSKTKTFSLNKPTQTDISTGEICAGGDLAGTYPNPQIASNVIVDSDINTAANISQSKISGLTTALTNKQSTSQKGVANGYAGLGADGLVPASQLPAASGGSGGGSPTGAASGDLTGTYPGPQIRAGVIIDSYISASANIDQTKINGLVAALSNKEVTTNKGFPNGYAALDSSGKVPTTQLPAGGSSSIPTGPAGGDLSGTYPDPTFAVDRLRRSGDTMIGTLTIATGSSGAFRVDGAAATNRDINFTTNVAGSPTLRWVMRTSNDAEGGGNAGSQFQLIARTDAGAAGPYALTITRNDGRILLAADPTAALGAVTKQYVDNKPFALNTTTITAGAGLTGGGDLTANRTIAINPDATLSAATQLSVVSAPKWTTARTISITGSVTGSASVDGSANVTIATTGGGGGGINRSINSVSVATTMAAAANTDYVYLCTGSSAFNITLPTAAANVNRYSVKRTGTANITIDTTSSQTIDGLSTFVLDYQQASVDLVSNGSNWMVI